MAEPMATLDTIKAHEDAQPATLDNIDKMEQGQVQYYAPKGDSANYLYSPPISGTFNAADLATTQLPTETPPANSPMSDWLEKNVFEPVFKSKYEAPPKVVPGRENTFKAGKAEAQQFIHDMTAMGAAGLERLNRANPILDPSQGYKPEFGKPLAPIEAEDIPELKTATVNAFPPYYLANKYIRPMLHTKDAQQYWNDVIVPYAKYQPLGTAADALMLGGPLKSLHGAVSLIGKTEKGQQALARLANLKQGAKVLGSTLINKIPVLGDEMQAYLTTKALLGKLSPEESAIERNLEASLLKAQAKIDPKDQPFLATALNRTDPRLDYLLDKPEVQRYANLQERLSNKRWLALIKRGLVDKNDWLATRVFPQFAAAVKRGEIDFPIKNLITGDVYNNSELQKALTAFAAKQGKKALTGRYNPQTPWSEVGNYQKGKIPKPLEKAVTSKRLKAGIDTSEIAGKEVTGLHYPGLSTIAALNMARKLSLTDRFLKTYDMLEGANALLEALPDAQRILTARRLEDAIKPLLEAAGITKPIIGEIEKLSRMAVDDANRLKIRDAIEKLAKTPGNLFEHAVGLLEPFARWQRAVSILLDLPWPFLLHGFQWLAYGMTGLKPGNLKNFIIAAKLSQDERIFSRIPSEFLEHRGPVEAGHPIVQLLSGYAQKFGYDPANKVRGASAILQMLDEYDRLHPAAQSFLLSVMKGQFDLQQRVQATLNMIGQLEGTIKGNKQAIEKLADQIISHNGDVYGRYKGPYGPMLRAARATSIWANMTMHAITLTGRVAMENPYKFAALRASAQRIGAQQIMEAKAAGVPDWAIKLGVVPTGKKASNGYVQVQFDSGFNLLLEAARAGLNVATVMEAFHHQLTGEGEDIPVNGIDAQLNFLIAGSLLFSGFMPYGHRPVMNPYQTKIEGNKYNVLKTAKEYQTRPPTNVSIKKDVETEPFDKLLDRILVSVGLGFSPKKWNYLKRMDGFIRQYEPSDLTVPGTDMAYPKVDKKAGVLSPAPSISPLEMLPGMHRLSEQRIKQAETYPTPVERTRRKQMSDEAKLHEAYKPFQGKQSKLLPKY